VTDAGGEHEAAGADLDHRPVPERGAPARRAAIDPRREAPGELDQLARSARTRPDREVVRFEQRIGDPSRAPRATDDQRFGAEREPSARVGAGLDPERGDGRPRPGRSTVGERPVGGRVVHARGSGIGARRPEPRRRVRPAYLLSRCGETDG
jgi:hypothetical protein